MRSPELGSVPAFTRYEKFVIAILSTLQFAVILDFVVLSPLGAILMPTLQIGPSQFGLVVSAYAFSAGASGLLAAGFADRFDRKKLLIFFFAGFLLGTAFCALAWNYYLLLAARIVTGIFGGVIGSIVMAIISDLFPLEKRGRVMGFAQMAFGASQILGLPIGLYLANRFDWHAPFWMIVGLGGVVGVLILLYMKPVNAHLTAQSRPDAVGHLLKTVNTRDYQKSFLATILLATGGYMLMPFGSAFSTNNLGLTMDQLPWIYGITGVSTMIFGPLIGRLSDSIGKIQVFTAGTLLSMVVIVYYTHLEITPMWVCTALNVVMFAGITARMISASALVSAIPDARDRGAFMSVTASLQQISGGVASAFAGLIVVQQAGGHLDRYDILGYVVIATMIVTILMMNWIDRHVRQLLTRRAAAS
ncbi:MAG: MFS transporter [Cyclobacteriaceae bacterium]|nr:MFS transporter [Cyclobacteriaceae bacterium]